MRYTAVSHLHRSNAVFSQGRSGGRLHLGLLLAIAEHCVQAVLARLAWLLICTVTEVWVAGLKGSRFDPCLCSGGVSPSLLGPGFGCECAKYF